MTAASSAANRHSRTPIAVAIAISGTAAAPSACTAGGAMPVTRIGPARPITNAPHQLVPLCNPESDCVVVDVMSDPFVHQPDTVSNRNSLSVDAGLVSSQ